MTSALPSILFLPGAAGAAEFWAPVAERLPPGWRTRLLSWPGAGHEPHDARVGSFDDLTARAAAALDTRADVVAQSMGGAVAIGLALRHPDRVRRLVLVASSGGLDVGALGAGDWRDEYRAEYPHAADWITAERPDHSRELAAITAPALLIWGDTDPLSPVAVGRRLAGLLPAAVLHVVTGGTHALARERPDEVARLIIDHLG